MNAEAWKRHFVAMAGGKFRDKPFYRVGAQQGSGDDAPIQLVTPTQQAVEMARAQEKDRSEPATKQRKRKKTIKKAVRKKSRHSKKRRAY